MPLIVLTGYPCSGLTHRARQLATQLEETQTELFNSGALPPSKPRYKIHVVPTHDPSHPRTVYDNARTEKETRGVAYARAKRALNKDSFVILDGMNYIKGYRYQLWCEAKALGTTCCVVHVGTPIDQCVANNEARLRRQNDTDHTKNQVETNDSNLEPTPASPSPSTSPEATTDSEDPYPPELLNNLIFRYEEPSIHSRWDKPLFTVPWTDSSPPIADIWTALTGIPHPSTTTPDATTTTTPTLSSLTIALNTTSLSSTASTTTTTPRTSGPLGRPKIKPHQATALPAQTDSSALYSMEKRTSAIVTAIRSFTLSNPSAEAALALAQSQNPNNRGSGNGISISVPEASTSVYIPAHVATSGTTDELAGAGGILALPRLQRLRRQWIALNRAYVQGAHASSKGGLSAEQVPDAFVRFLNAEFEGESE